MCYCNYRMIYSNVSTMWGKCRGNLSPVDITFVLPALYIQIWTNLSVTTGASHIPPRAGEAKAMELTCLSSWASAWLTDGWRTCTCNWDSSPAGTSTGSSVSWHLCSKPDSMGGDGNKVHSAHAVYDEAREQSQGATTGIYYDELTLIKQHFSQGITPTTLY